MMIIIAMALVGGSFWFADQALLWHDARHRPLATLCIALSMGSMASGIVLFGMGFATLYK